MSTDDNQTSLQTPFDDPDLTALPVTAERTPQPPPDEADATRYEPAGQPGRSATPPPSTPRPTLSPGRGAARDGAADAPGDQGPLAVGQAFGPRYRITRVLGVGGMGAVYQAWDAELGVDVAVKVIRPEIAADPTAATEIERRFKRELLLARQVTHPNIIRIHDLGDIDGI
jgi:serine/threonine protein kinase